MNAHTVIIETSGTVGTGAMSLGGAPNNSVGSFVSVFANNTTVGYYIADQSGQGLYETGVGTFTTNPNSLSRLNVLNNSYGAGNTSFVSFAGNSLVYFNQDAYTSNTDTNNLTVANTLTVGVELLIGSGPTVANAVAIITGDLYATDAVFISDRITGTANNSAYYRSGGVTRFWDNHFGDVFSYSNTGVINFDAGVKFTGVPVPQLQGIGGSGTYTTPAGALWLEVECVGGGGGGGASGPGSSVGGTGGTTFFGGIMSADGGAGAGAITDGPTGGSASGGDINIPGGNGGASNYGGSAGAITSGGNGGVSYYGGGGAGGAAGNIGEPGTAYGSGGGGGAADPTDSWSAGGGAAGGYCRKIVSNPSATYSVTIGAGGTQGFSCGAYSGGGGQQGLILVTAHFI